MAFSDRLSVAASHPLVDAGEKKGGRKRIPFSLHMHVVFLCGAAQGIEQKLDGLTKNNALFVEAGEANNALFFFSYVPSLHAVGSTPFFFFSLVMSVLSSLLFFFFTSPSFSWSVD